MPNSPEATLLSACQLEIELAWNEARDDSAVHRLAAAHPALAEELYDFFADVIEAEDDVDVPRPELAESARKIRELLRRAGSQDGPKRPKPFLALVRDASGEHVDAIAAAMEVPLDFLVDASKHGAVLPLAARAEFVRRARAVCDIDEDEGIASFDVPSTFRRAASRSGPYQADDVTYTRVVERSSLSPALKRFWSALA